MASKVLIATPGADRAGELAEAFAQKGGMPTVAFDASQLIEFVDYEHFDLVTVDLRIAKEKRSDVVRSVLERTRGAVLGLSYGDDDDVRLAALGLRSQVPVDAPPGEIATAGAMLIGITPEAISGTTLRWQPLELDTGRREGFWQGHPLHLTKLQFRVLTALVRAEGNVVSCERLSHVVYGNAVPGDGERLLAHVRRIRKKIEPMPSTPQYLLTVRGEGFRLAEPGKDCLAS